nr:Gag-Pol polyprotein [Tanacetum cinerariifolium]
MTGAKFDIKKFDGTGDFRLWIIKMRTLLIQHGCEAALEVLPVDMEAQTKAGLNKKAHSAIILCLGNKVLREVTRETTAAGVWSKLETLYMTNSLANKLYLKKKLYTFYMSAGRKISEHIDEFNKIVLDFANIEVKFEDKYLALLLLTSLPASYEHFVDTLLYGQEALTLEDVMATLNSKEIKKMSKTKGDDGGGLYVRGRTDRISQGENQDRSLELGNNGECKIRGIGKVRVQLKDGSSFVLHSVRYIRELKRNLISLETLKKEGYTVKLQSGKVKVINGSTVILSGIRRDNCVYSLDGHAMSSELNAYVKEKDSLAKAYYSGSDRLCPFRLIRCVSGGIIGRTAKKLRTDNGLEFCNREFEQLCIESGIARHFIVFGTPQQNGVAERMNRTLMDKVRCLLIQSGLPKTFRAEVTFTATYLINRSLSREIEKKTLIEMWSGHPSDYGMLRIFGCVAYPHDKQGKLEPRAVKCVLLGYPEGVKGYKLYRLDDESFKIVTSRNVAGVELQRLNNHTPKGDQTNQEDGDDEDTGDHEENTHKPLTYQEAVACEDNCKWKAAMKEEMDSRRKNNTWELEDHLAGQKLISYKWLFNIKEGIEGVQNPRYKARLLARGFTQRPGIDYNKVFSLVVRHTSIRVILALTPLGYEQGNKVCLLKKSLYSLKQSPRQWYRMFDEYMLSYGFKRSSYDSCVYYRSYVPGVLHEGARESKEDSWYGDRPGLGSIDNGKSVKMPLGGHFKLSVRDCDVERMSKVPYANAVGSIMYLMVCTRPDIAYAVLETWVWCMEKNHGNHVDVTGFVDSDYAKDPDKEAEYMALTKAVKEAIWLRGLLKKLGVEVNTMAVSCDNQGAIHLSRNYVFHERTKHINMRYHFIREVLEAKTVKLLKVGTEHNVVDALTKVVPGLKLQHCLELLNVGKG